MGYNNLGCDLRNYEGPQAALEVLTEGVRFATARGLEAAALMIRGSALPAMLSSGDLSATLAAAAELAVHAEDTGDEANLIEIRAIHALALTYTGRADETRNILDLIVDAARRSGRPDAIVSGFGCAAVVHATLGGHQEAGGLLTDIASAQVSTTPLNWPPICLCSCAPPSPSATPASAPSRRPPHPPLSLRRACVGGGTSSP